MKIKEEYELKFIGSYIFDGKDQVKFLGGRLVKLSGDQFVVPQLMNKPGYYYDRVVTIRGEQTK